MMGPIFLVVCILIAVPTSEADSCQVSKADRVDCGYSGIGRDRCVARGCCHDTSIPDVPWCFFKKPGRATALTGTCPVPPESRVECGWPGISKETCEGRNCCFDSSVQNAKWCFEKHYACAVSPTDRKDCGYPGIGRDRCVARGCCHDTTTPNVPWCFFKKGDTAATLLMGTCPVPPESRVECGWPGISKETCEGRKCCFDSSVRNAKWCFEKDYSCAVAPTDRKDCGYSGIGRDRCVARGCCHDTTTPNVPWCFFKMGGTASAWKGSCPVPPESRVECGWPGISKETCEGRNCCFDSSVRNAKWCFEKDYSSREPRGN